MRSWINFRARSDGSERGARLRRRKAEFVSQQRLQEGVDSKLEVTRSQLVAARIRLRIAEAQDQSDVLREHLAKSAETCRPLRSPSSRIRAADAGRSLRMTTWRHER